MSRLRKRSPLPLVRKRIVMMGDNVRVDDEVPNALDTDDRTAAANKRMGSVVVNGLILLLLFRRCRSRQAEQNWSIGRSMQQGR